MRTAQPNCALENIFLTDPYYIQITLKLNILTGTISTVNPIN